jgi:hypothetical protein
MRTTTCTFVASASLLLSLALVAPPARAVPLRVTGPFPAAAAAPTLVDAARAVLHGAVPASASLDFASPVVVSLASGHRVVKMGQLHRGVPVARRGAAVAFGPDGAARLVSAHLADRLPANVTPTFARAAAASLAAARARHPVRPDEPVLAVWPTLASAQDRLAWVIAPRPIPGVPRAPVVILDAHSGALIAAYDAAVSIDAAHVYPTNPVASPTLAPVKLPVASGTSALQNELLVSYNCIDDGTTSPIDFQGQGTVNVRVCHVLSNAPPDAGGDYEYPPAGDTTPEDAFSEVSMFHHANRAYAFFRAMSPALNVNGSFPLATISNVRLAPGVEPFDPATLLSSGNTALKPYSNAAYVPAGALIGSLEGQGGNSIIFGQGPARDYSYDGDVIYHEFTHAVVDATIRLSGYPRLDTYGLSAAPGAMNEGLADYFSCAIAGDPDVGEYAVGDTSPGMSYIRSLTDGAACPAHITGESHADSTLFSGALWDARTGLSAAQQAEYDAAVFAAMNTASSGDLGYEDLAQLILDAVSASSLGSAVSDGLSTAFATHGVLPRCTRVLENTGKEMSASEDLSGYWFAYGATMAQTSGAGFTPGVVQVHTKLPAGTTSLDVQLQKRDWPNGFGGAPFSPKILVRFGSTPITFDLQPLALPADVLSIDGAGAGSYGVSASVPVPAGAGDAYVMIANGGDDDGLYTSLTIDPVGGASSSSSSSSSSSGTGGAATSSSSSGGATTDAGGGCTCAMPGDLGDLRGAALAALAALGAAAARRRRR